MFIDDLHLATLGQSDATVHRDVIAACADMAVIVETEWQCSIASKKTAVAASYDALQGKIFRSLGSYAVKNAPGAAANLGVDYFSGQLRSRKVSRHTLSMRLN